MKVIISGGGTGGHIFPAVAIANEIKARHADAEILFVGALGKMEMEKVPKAGYEIEGLPVVGFNRSNLIANLGFPVKLIQSLWRAYKIVKNFKPDMAIGVGGFASGPTLAMANLLGIKTLIQEQNSYAGVTNKILGKRASKICVAYPGMEAFFPANKIVFTGNPVRKDIFPSKISPENARAFFKLDPNKKTLLVIGGSLGAKSINQAIAKSVQSFVAQGIQVIWQTGKPFIAEAQAVVASLNSPNIYVADFIYDMHEAYAAADLVVSRAGALSVSELAILAKPSILVPYPFAAEDHQTQNAKTLSDKNAAILIPDDKIGALIEKAVLELASDSAKTDQLASEIAYFAKPNAAKDIVDLIQAIIKK